MTPNISLREVLTDPDLLGAALGPTETWKTWLAVLSAGFGLPLDDKDLIGIHTNNFRTVRGRTLVGVIFDEVAFWRDETSATPDVEVYRAVKPALDASGGMLIGISSPYRRTGLLAARHRDHFGKDSDVLV